MSQRIGMGVALSEIGRERSRLHRRAARDGSASRTAAAEPEIGPTRGEPI